MYDEEGNLLTPQEDGFFSSAMSRIQSFVQPVQDFASTPVGSQVFQAIYEYGRGKIDAAREKAVGAFLMTSEGKKAQAEAARQTVNQYFPAIAIGVAVILFLLFALRK